MSTRFLAIFAAVLIAGILVPLDRAHAQPPPPPSAIYVNKAIEGGGPDGTFSFTATGGLPAFQITTSGGNGGQVFEGLMAGDYTVTEAETPGFQLTAIQCKQSGENSNVSVDLANRRVSITLAGGENVSCSFTNKEGGPPSTKTSITIVKRAIKGSGTFTFVSPTPALAMKLTTNDTVSSGAKTLPPGSYTITELQDVPFFYLASIACNDPDGGTSTSVSNATAVIDLDVGENITCTFTNIDPRPQTKAVIERFMHHRLTALLDADPDRPRFIRRFPGSLWGGSSGTGATSSTPFNLAMSEADGKASFSTSLSQMASAMAGVDKAKEQQAMSLGSAALNGRPGPAPYSGVDIWTEAHFTAFEDDIGNGNADGDFDILYVGADIPLTTNLLVGILGQFDWAKEHTKLDGSSAEGKGWMVGPYLSARIDEHLFFDWRAAWGQSDNEVSPFGTYTDSFDTDRWLTTARLTGNWTSGNWRLTPSAAFKYGEEEQQAYTDTNGIRITGQTASLGRVEFGPEFGYRWGLADGTLIEPQMALYGVWNFDNGGSVLVGDTFVTPDDFTARLEGGVLVQLPKGMSFRGAASYDGLGSDEYEAVTGKVWLNWPLN